MKKATNPTSKSPLKVLFKAIFLSLLGSLLCLTSSLQAGERQDHCSANAEQTFNSCARNALADFWLERAKCENLSGSLGDRNRCRGAAWRIFLEGLGECQDRLLARFDVCEGLGEAAYDPVIDPANFVSVIDHPLFPHTPGTTRVYEKETDEGLEVIRVTATHETKEILGVTCTVIHDIASLDGEVVEDTFDWFAQDVDGNVWYFGELSRDFEDGQIVDLAGTWKAGEDGAKPGILMMASPQPGQLYRQEFAVAEAEDMGQVLFLDQSVSVAYGDFEGCLQTVDFTPIEPGALEHKFYAPGIGVVLEIDVESGDRLELVDILVE